MKVIFFGTSEFAKEQLLFLIHNKIQIVAVVTQPDRPRGRSQKTSPPPVKQLIIDLNLNIPVFQPEKAQDPIFIESLKQFYADLFIVVAYGQILKRQLIDIPRLGCINVHASLLPKYRGAAPIQRAIMNGEKTTGITIMKIVEKLDAGDMLLKKSVSISPDMTFNQLELILSQISGPALLEVIKEFERDEVKSVPQDETLVTYAAKILPEEALLDFKLPAEVLHNKIRGLSPKPGAYCLIEIDSEVKRLKILRSKVIHQNDLPYNTIEFSNKRWVVACGKDALELLEIQMEGKQAISFSEWFKGCKKQPHIKNI